MITPSEQQNDAIKAIASWYKLRNKKPFFYLAGFAGVGKTTILPHIMEACNISGNVCYGSFTGKAAYVMRKKGIKNASTLHSLVYRAQEYYENNIRKIRFVRNDEESPLRDAKLLVIDECSMVDKKMAMDILHFEVPILVLGDPGQLPPINGEGYFTSDEPDFFLTEVHRQAADNPIILMAHCARQGQMIPMGDYGSCKRIPRVQSNVELLCSHDQVITGKNATRHALNRQMLKHEGFDIDALPTSANIKLICLKNNHERGLINGMFAYSKSGAKVGNETSQSFRMDVLTDDDQLYQSLKIATVHFLEGSNKLTKKEVESMKNKIDFKETAEFDYGLCCTVHKFQGSQAESVAIYDDGFASWDPVLRARFLYTAITRASDRLTLIG